MAIEHSGSTPADLPLLRIIKWSWVLVLTSEGFVFLHINVHSMRLNFLLTWTKLKTFGPSRLKIDSDEINFFISNLEKDVSKDSDSTNEDSDTWFSALNGNIRTHFILSEPGKSKNGSAVKLNVALIATLSFNVTRVISTCRGCWSMPAFIWVEKKLS